MGPGPSDVAPSVLEAMAKPMIGHLDPEFVRMMEEIKAQLRAVFQTRNEMTFPVSGTGSAGMEFCLVNLRITSQPGHQLWQLNSVGVPEGIDEAVVRKRLLQEFNLEIGAGLGPLKGRVWRVGLMGHTSTVENVHAFLGAFADCLKRA
jgi:aspartate aminotransferase-like enzyme